MILLDAAVVETFKYGFTGVGTFEWSYLAYSAGFMVFIVLLGILLFNKIEKTFVDII